MGLARELARELARGLARGLARKLAMGNGSTPAQIPADRDTLSLVAMRVLLPTHGIAQFGVGAVCGNISTGRQECRKNPDQMILAQNDPGTK